MGQTLHGVVRLVTFLQFLASLASCQENSTVENTTSSYVCSDPVVKNAKTLPSQVSFIEGDAVELTCQDDYRVPYTRSNVIHLKCKADGTWGNYLDFEPTPTCERIGGCPSPKITHLLVFEHTTGFMPGNVLPVVCETGFRPTVPKNLSFIACQKDGTWSMENGVKILPQCEAIPCSIPTEFPHGSIKIDINLALGPMGMFAEEVPDSSIIQYLCDEDYMLSDETKRELKCINGAWSNSPPVCIAKKDSSGCHRPQIVQHAFVHISTMEMEVEYEDSLPEGTEVTYTCHDGYGVESTLLFCVRGNWVGRLPSCIRQAKSCLTPPAILHGDFMSITENNATGRPVYLDGVKVYYYCYNGYRLANASWSSLHCVDGMWEGTIAECERRTHCDSPMDIPDGNWVVSMYLHNFMIGSKVIYECREGYKAVGPTEIVCLSSGYWSDYAPRCLAADKYCSEPGPIDNGVYMCRPSHCDLFKIGTEVHYVCNKDYEPQDTDIMVQKCLNQGIWSGRIPNCTREVLEAATDAITFNISTLTIVIATSCGVLGLLIVVMIIVALQRRSKLRSNRLCPPSSPPPPPPYSVTPTSLVDEPDRLALIAFADGVQVVLPSYDEAVRGRPTSRLSRYNSDSTRGSIRSSSSRGDYRPLPSLPPNMRGGVQIREIPVELTHDHHRNSIITTTSITTRDNLSLTLGSMDTVNISDGTSTTVTVDTASSNFSIATSQRAAAGSIESGSTNGSIDTEDAPLLDQNHYGSETMRSHHSNHSSASETLHSLAHRCQSADGGAYEALQNQTNARSQTDSSAIAEVPEELKDA